MSVLSSFQPTYGAGINQTATTSSLAYVIDPNVGKSGGGNKTVVVTNKGNTNGLYVRVGKGSAIVATSADNFVPAGGQVALTKAETDDYIALLADASTTAVHAIPGEGF